MQLIHDNNGCDNIAHELFAFYLLLYYDKKIFSSGNILLKERI